MARNEIHKKSESSLGNAVMLAFAGFLYMLFHLRLGGGLADSARATLGQMLLTAPYAAGFTYILIHAHSRLARTTGRPHWTRVARLFFTVGVCFGLFFALYEYGGGDPFDPASAGGFWGGGPPKAR